MDMINSRMVNIFQFHFSSSIDIAGFLCNLKVKRMKIQGISPNQFNKGYVEYLSIFMQQVAFQGGIQICLFLVFLYFVYLVKLRLKDQLQVERSAFSNLQRELTKVQEQNAT